MTNNDELIQLLRNELNPLKDDIRQIKSELNPLKDDIGQIMLELENNVSRKLSLLIEGQEMILERMPEMNEINALKERVKLLESVVKEHSSLIKSLKKAQ